MVDFAQDTNDAFDFDAADAGDTPPSEGDRAQNRRVEIEIIKPNLSSIEDAGQGNDGTGNDSFDFSDSSAGDDGGQFAQRNLTPGDLEQILGERTRELEGGGVFGDNGGGGNSAEEGSAFSEQSSGGTAPQDFGDLF